MTPDDVAARGLAVICRDAASLDEIAAEIGIRKLDCESLESFRLSLAWALAMALGELAPHPAPAPATLGLRKAVRRRGQR